MPDRVSEKKRQRSPECSPPSSPPHSRSNTPIQNRDAAAKVDTLDQVTKQDEIVPQSAVSESHSQTDCTEKIEITPSTFLGLQPFGRNKNKGFRPISFNPPNSKLAQPVS